MRLSFMTRTSVALFAGVALAFGAAACDEETRDKAGDAVESAREDVEESVDEAGARGAAESFRVSLKAQDTDDDAGGVRAIDALNEAADDLPGDPEVLGIGDGNGDGADDDGLVEIRVGEELACVTLPTSGNEIDVTGGAC
jgi:hypothetical protein